MLSEFIDTGFVKHMFTFWESLVYLFLMPLGFLLGKLLFQQYYKFQAPSFSLNDHLVEHDNKAAAVAFAGFEVGMGLVMWGAISDQDPTNHVDNMWGGIVWSLIGFCFFMLAVFINDKGMLRSLTIVPEIERGNIAAGLTVAGNYIAAGLTCLYTIGGGGSNWGENIGSAVLFFVLCQAEFFVFYYVIRFALRRYGSIDFHIRAGNVAIGTVVCVSRIAISIMATNPLRTTEELLAFFVWFGCACLFMLVFEFLSFHILLQNATIVEDVLKYQNWGATLVQGSALCMVCIASMSFLPGQCRTVETGSKNLGERLTTTDYTSENIFRWPNLIFICFIFCYAFSTKYIFAFPGIIQRLCDKKRSGSIPWGSAFRNYLRAPRKHRQSYHSDVAFEEAPSTSHFSQEGEEMDAIDRILAEEDAPTAPLDRSVSNLSRKSDHDDDFNPSNDSQRVNISRACSFSGYLISVGILLRSAIAVTNSPEIPTTDMLMYTFYWIAIGILMQHAGYFLQRFLLWGRTHPVSSLTTAAGILDGCIYIVVAMQVGSNLFGNNELGPFNLQEDTAVTMLFFVLQMVCTTISGKVFQLMTSFDDIKAVVEHDNAAVALANGLGLIAGGILTQMVGSRTVEMATLFAFFFPALLAMHLNRKLVTDKLIMPSQSLDKELLHDRNWGAALVSGSISCIFCAGMTSFVREICAKPPIVALVLSSTMAPGNATNTTG